MSKNNEAWNEIFAKYKILEKIGRSELFFIDANQIKEFREPRLMTKFDHQTSLPDMFKKNNLSILPITR
jgi:hypothetical protein